MIPMFLAGNENVFPQVMAIIFLTFVAFFAAPKPEAAETSTYKVPEYYSYNEFTFYDLENVIDSSGRRQIQPDPKEKYHHTDPWTKQEKSAA